MAGGRRTATSVIAAVATDERGWRSRLRHRLSGMAIGRTLLRMRLRLVYAGWRRHCPVCGSWLRRFLPHGVPLREDAVCPVCQSRERHRLAWLWFKARPEAAGDRPVLLHLAPEAGLERRLRRSGRYRYYTADLTHLADVRLDICRLPFRDASIDIVYCSHVLNMLPDDRPALAELSRVLRPDGIAVLQVPSSGVPDDVEAGSDSTARERSARFHDPDIFRQYGDRSISCKLRAVGLETQRLASAEQFSLAQRRRFGLSDEVLWLGRRAA